MAEITVLHVVPDLRRKAGGIAATVPALAEALRALGVESRFVTFAHDGDPDPAGRMTLAAARDARRPDRLGRLMGAALSDLPPDTVLHSHGLWTLLNHAGMAAAARMGRPTVLSLHGMLLPWARRHRKLRKDLAWLLYQRRDLLRADRVHVTSAEEARIATAIAGEAAVARISFGVALPEAPPPA
ncbi:MAG: hypothetical protein EP307_04215, partial [Rhodobacteraceae bacterium]